MRRLHIGVDAGSITTKAAAIDEAGAVVAHVYLRNSGNPIGAVLTAVRDVGKQLGRSVRVLGVGTTGSARELAAALVGADIVKNEITAHALATLHIVPEARTVIEIGGQESKLIILEDGAVVDFRLNTICAAGTGSFLDHQAERMGISVSKLGELAASAGSSARISGLCTVFAETDMIQKQQMGYGRDEICAGLCDALAEGYLSNVAKGKSLERPIVGYLSNVAKGKSLERPIVFQGGVAANAGMRQAFERQLKWEIIIPKQFALMGAIGVAMLAKRLKDWDASRFRGFDLSTDVKRGDSFTCDGCENRCEIVRLLADMELLAYLGSRCGKW